MALNASHTLLPAQLRPHFRAFTFPLYVQPRHVYRRRILRVVCRDCGKGHNSTLDMDSIVEAALLKHALLHHGHVTSEDGRAG